MAEFKLPTEIVDLPSKGLLYPKDNPLSSGQVEIKYMTAKEEDILTNQSYIQNGTVLDKLFQSLIVSKINYNDLLIGDKNAIMVAARILGYGKDYNFTYNGKEETIDLTQLQDKEVDTSLFSDANQFEFEFPHSGNKITFKLLTHGDEIKISRELAGLKKIKKDASPDLSTRLKYMITSIEGDDTPKAVRDFVDNYLLAQDSRAFRSYVNKISPDIDLTFFPDESEKRVSIPIGLSFFWPDFD
jgi:translation initiation factor IF-3